MSSSFFKIGKFSGKGAAAVTCLCLAAVAAAGVYTYNRSEKNEGGLQLEASDDTAAGTESPEVRDADAVQHDVPLLPAEDLFPEEAEDVAGSGITDETEVTGAPEAPDAPEAGPFEKVEALTMGIAVRPLDGNVIQPYSDGELVRSETLGVWKTHDGIDIAGAQGEPIRAAAEGTVTAVFSDPMWGNCIVIEHSGGYESCYYGISDTIYVSENDTVSAGSEIAEVGDTADIEAAEESHLHFGMKKNGEWVDPAERLSGYGS